MLEIFIRFKLGQAINRKASSKGWPGWPFVLAMIAMYVVLSFGCGIIAVLLTMDANPNAGGNDDLFPFIIGYALGAIAAALSSYFVVLILPDRSEPDRDDGDDDDRPRRWALREDDGDDDRDVPRAHRADDSDDDRRRR